MGGWEGYGREFGGHLANKEGVMSISELFSEKLGAPLSDTRWSWGAINQATGQVFLGAVRNVP